MARVMKDTTEVYRTFVKYEAPWMESGEGTALYGPYDGPAGRAQAERRLKDQHGNVIEAKVQKLEAVLREVAGELLPELKWVGVDE